MTSECPSPPDNEEPAFTELAFLTLSGQGPGLPPPPTTRGHLREQGRAILQRGVLPPLTDTDTDEPTAAQVAAFQEQAAREAAHPSFMRLVGWAGKVIELFSGRPV